MGRAMTNKRELALDILTLSDSAARDIYRTVLRVEIERVTGKPFIPSVLAGRVFDITAACIEHLQGRANEPEPERAP